MKSLLDILFGQRTHWYEEEAMHKDRVNFSEHADDDRRVMFVLKSIWRGRQRGPQWARKTECVGFITHWTANKGVPVKNYYDGSEKLVKSADFETSIVMGGDMELWKIWAPAKLWVDIKDLRNKNGYLRTGEKFRANND